jgi:hypothetical protein
MCEFPIILHIVSLSIRLCLSLYVMLRFARHKTSQKKKLCILHGRYCGVHLTPSGTKQKYKINEKTRKLANVCDIVSKALRKKIRKRLRQYS